MATGLVFDKRFALHEMGPDHIESPLRTIVLQDVLTTRLKGFYVPVTPRPATEEELGFVHLPSYVSFLKETAGQDYFSLILILLLAPTPTRLPAWRPGLGWWRLISSWTGK